MNLTKYPQFHLYLLTLHLMLMRPQLLPKNCDERCVNATIINRAYYSSYLYCALWLEDLKKFKPVASWEFEDDEIKISKHKQIRNALSNYDELKISSELQDLFNLRFKADYEPFVDISDDEVDDALYHMKYIFNHLKF